VGRAAETAAIEQAWTHVRAGTRELIFVGGEPGAGKSRLVEEVGAALHHRGAVLLIGTCLQEPARPYGPFVECLEQLFGGTPEGALADRLPDSARELLRLTPLVGRHRSDLQPPTGDDGDYRRKLFDSFADVLHAISTDRPVVCVIDDLHWAGAPNLQLLSHLAQHLPHSRLLILGTHRTTAPDRSEELTYAIADLYRLDGVRRIDLSGLTTDEVTEYLVIEGGLPVRRAREQAAVLRDQTGGNPFFLREVLRDLADRGGASMRPVRTTAPASIRDTLQRRLGSLTPVERAVIETAAVLGDDGDVEVLADACSCTAAALLEAIDAAARFGLIDAAALVTGRVTFPHSLTRQAVLDLIEPSRLAHLHARIAEVLSTSEAQSPRMVCQLAYHYSRASALGHGTKAVEYLVLSAREAERSLAFEDAAAQYAQAAELRHGAGADREELLFTAARCHVLAGDFARARALYLRLHGSADRHVRLRAAIGFEDAGWRPGLPGTDAYSMLATALDQTPADPDDPEYVWALASLGRAMAFTGHGEQARAVGERALSHARRIGEQRLLLHALQTMMWHAITPGALDQHSRIVNELTQVARLARDWEALGTASVFGSAIAYMRADPVAWAEALADLDRAVRGSGQPFMAYMRGCTDHARAFLGGDFAGAERIAEELVELGGRAFGSDDTEGPYGLQMYMVRRETGALQAIRPLVATASQSGQTWQPGLLALYTELGLQDETRRLLSELVAKLGATAVRQTPWAQWTAVLVFLVEAAVAVGNVDAARTLRSLLAPYAGLQLIAGQFVAVFGPADAYLASLDSLLGDDESAERLFQQALQQATAIDSVVHRATTLAAWATHLRTRSGSSSRSRAEEMAEEARRLAAGTGQHRVQRILRPPADPPAGLSTREIDVLRLLAQGASNRDIAAQLRISENTAANHVRNILLKTGAANRTQVATMAVARRWLDQASPRPGQ
jgi:DNA-binding CsgD family transcriptional regulator